MAVYPGSIGPLVLRLLAAVAMLGCPRMGSATGAWSIFPLPQQPGEMSSPRAVAVDGTGSFYVGGIYGGNLLQRRDTQGNWSVIAVFGTDLGQVSKPI